jgi:hypothetical protein
VNGKWYIGKYEGSKPSYLGSGVAIMRAIKKYGKEKFIREILAESETGKQLAELEKEFIIKTNARNDPMSYNIAEGGIGGKTYDYSQRTDLHKRNISKALAGKTRSPRTQETKNKISLSIRNNNAIWKIMNVHTGEEFLINCLDEFCKIHNVAPKTIRYSAKEGKIVKNKYLASKMETK